MTYVKSKQEILKLRISRISLLTKDLLSYGFGNFLYTLVQLISMPLIVRSLSVAEVTQWNILLPTGALLSALITFGMDSALVRFIVDKNESEKRVVFSNCFFFVIFFSLLTGALCWLGSSIVTSIINLSPTGLTSYSLLLFWLPGMILAQLFQNWFKYTFQRSSFILNVTLQSGSYLLLILVLVILKKIDLTNVMRVSLVSIWVSALFAFFRTRKMFVFKIKKDLLISTLAYGSPFMVLAFGFNLIFSFDKFILARNVIESEFAIYSQAFRVTGIFSVIVSSFHFAFGPFSLTLLGKDDASELLADLQTYYLYVINLIGIIFIVMSKSLIEFFSGAAYVTGYQYVPIFILGYIFYGLYSFVQLGFIYSKKSYLGLFSLFFGLVTVISTDLFLVVSYKGFGTALGFALGMIVMVVVAALLSKPYLLVKYNHIKDCALMLVFVLFGVLHSKYTFSGKLLVDSFFKVSFSVFFFLILFFSTFFTKERQLLTQIFKKSYS